MSRLPKLHFDATAVEYIQDRVFAVTKPIFTPEMGAALVILRKNLNLTQKKLAEQLGLNQTDLSRIEKGKNINAMPTCEKFKSVLGKQFLNLILPLGSWNQSDLTIEHDKALKKYYARIRT